MNYSLLDVLHSVFVPGFIPLLMPPLLCLKAFPHLDLPLTYSSLMAQFQTPLFLKLSRYRFYLKFSFSFFCFLSVLYLTAKEFTPGYFLLYMLLIVSVFPPLDYGFLKTWTISESSFVFYVVYNGDFSFKWPVNAELKICYTYLLLEIFCKDILPKVLYCSRLLAG